MQDRDVPSTKSLLADGEGLALERSGMHAAISNRHTCVHQCTIVTLAGQSSCSRLGAKANSPTLKKLYLRENVCDF